VIRPLLDSSISKFAATFALHATHNYCSKTNEDCVVISLSSRHHGAKRFCNSGSFKSDCDRYPGVSLNDVIVDDAREHARSCLLLMTLNTVSWQWRRWWRRNVGGMRWSKNQWFLFVTLHPNFCFLYIDTTN